MIAQTAKRQLLSAAPGVYRTLRLLRWRLKNRRRVIAHLTMPRGAGGSPAVTELRREGIVVRPYGEAVGAGNDLYDETRQLAERLRDAWLAERDRGTEQSTRKPYRAQLLHGQIDRASPFVRLGTDSQILSEVNSYLGMLSCLRAIELWWDSPTPGPAEESQLWHRDADDLMNVKVFVYFNDVELTTGPFSFVPRTHPLGDRRGIQVATDALGRASDEAMQQAISQSEWRVCTGPAGTVTLCDTCGYHRGLKPTLNSRLMLMFHYTSGTPMYPREFKLEGLPGRALSPAQLLALE